MSDSEPTHPRFRERMAEIEDQSVRSRKRKLIAFAVLVLVVLLGIASTQSALFDVDEVRVVGAARTDPEILRQVAAVELGTPVLGLDTQEIEERIQALPQVRSVVASKSWRGVVTIDIDERLPVARVPVANGTLVVAGDGIVVDLIENPVADVLPEEQDPFAQAEAQNPDDLQSEDEQAVIEQAPLPPDIQGLPEIAGAMFTSEPGEQIPDVLDEALIVAAALPADITAITERIEITVDSLVLKAVGGGLISLGDARDLDLKFDAVRAFLAQVDLSCLDTLNVAAPSVPVIRRNTGC